MRRSLITATAVLTTLFAAAFSPETDQSSAQRKDWTPCGCFCGFEPPYPPVPPVGYVIFNSQPCTGILSADACRTELSNLPAAQLASVCDKVKASKNFKSFKQSCPVFAAFCPEEKKSTDCEQPTPWFGPPPAGCKDVQTPVVAISGNTVSLTVCGFPVFSQPIQDELNRRAAMEVLKSGLKERIGSKVCCDKFREAAKSGQPCQPEVDIDCDGTADHRDVDSAGFPVINRIFTRAPGATIDPFPPGLDPDDTEFFPPQDKCDCKWQLVKGTLNCSPDKKQPHNYQARWRCPSTGNERFTRKEAPATAACF